ncbi:MAG: hypothetical protein AAF675_14325 [Pseudomonadota bacterium]
MVDRSKTAMVDDSSVDTRQSKRDILIRDQVRAPSCSRSDKVWWEEGSMLDAAYYGAAVLGMTLYAAVVVLAIA